MILTVTPNPAVDVTIEVDTLAIGHSQVIPASRRRAGGKGLNVARVLAQTGHDAAAAGPVGADELAWFAQDLPGVRAVLTGCALPARCTYALVETGPGRTSQLNERGPVRTAAEWERVVQAVREAAAGARAVTVSGSIPPGAPDDLVRRILAAAGTAPVIADLSGAPLRAAARAGAAILKPNREELAATVGDADPVAGAAALAAEGAGLVVVSLGEDGMIAVPRSGDRLHARLPQPLRGNPTGAGDAAVAALASFYDDEVAPASALDAALRRAVAWSAAAVLAPLAGSLDPAHTDLARDVIVTAC